MWECSTKLRALAALAMFPLAAHAQPLVEVNAPAINCVFAASCTITVSDTTGNLLLPTLAPGTAWLQSRTGTTGYEYRLSMTQTSVAADCVTGLALNFGPSKQLPYKDNALADVFVITTGGLGTIGIRSAERSGDAIVFEFKAPLCADGPPDIKRTTFFFGLAAAAAPMHVNASVSVIGFPPIYAVDARVPTHPVAADPPGGL